MQSLHMHSTMIGWGLLHDLSGKSVGRKIGAQRTTRLITVCKFIGIPWHQLLHSTPPRARVLGNFRKENSRSK